MRRATWNEKYALRGNNDSIFYCPKKERTSYRLQYSQTLKSVEYCLRCVSATKRMEKTRAAPKWQQAMPHDRTRKKINIEAQNKGTQKLNWQNVVCAQTKSKQSLTRREFYLLKNQMKSEWKNVAKWGSDSCQKPRCSMQINRADLSWEWERTRRMNVALNPGACTSQQRFHNTRWRRRRTFCT